VLSSKLSTSESSCGNARDEAELDRRELTRSKISKVAKHLKRKNVQVLAMKASPCISLQTPLLCLQLRQVRVAGQPFFLWPLSFKCGKSYPVSSLSLQVKRNKYNNPQVPQPPPSTFSSPSVTLTPSTQVPLFPPSFLTTLKPSIHMPLSTALHIS
jgi:hypothetical protein